MKRQPGEPLFDFPCSYAFRAFEAEQEGITLSALEPKQDENFQVIDEKYVYTYWPTKAIDGIRGELLYLRDKVKELEAKRKQGSAF